MLRGRMHGGSAVPRHCTEALPCPSRRVPIMSSDLHDTLTEVTGTLEHHTWSSNCERHTACG